MTDEDRAALEAELTRLKRKLHAREDQPGFAQNCEALAARIAEIEALLAEPQ
jgi:cell fate (sporulation/competence/biofilm development) regulator YlbF (YheA/YmcA/DUF963 family)